MARHEQSQQQGPSAMHERPGERAVLAGMVALVALAPLLVGGALAWTQVGLSAGCLVALLAVYLVMRRDRSPSADVDAVPGPRATPRPARAVSSGLSADASAPAASTDHAEAGGRSRLRWLVVGPTLKLPPLSGALLLAVAATALQLVPLPRALVALLSPRALELRTDALGAAPALLPLTLDVPATALELAKALAVAGLFVSVAAVAHRARRATVVLGGIAATGAALALLALGQRAVGAQRILGVYRPDVPAAFVATFVDANHAAELFGLSLCLCIGFIADRRRARGLAQGLAIGGVVLCAVGLALTMSRAGMLVFALAALVLLTLVLGERVGRAAGAALAVVIVAASVGLLDAVEGVGARLAELDAAAATGRRLVDSWRATLALMRDFFATGVGRGAFAAPLERYRAAVDGTTVGHPENLLLQLGAEWGVPLAAAVLGLAALAALRHRRRLLRLGPLEWSAAVGVGGVVAQNLVDFGLELPGVALPVAATAGALVGRMCARDKVQRRRVGRAGLLAFAGAWAGALALAAWSAPRTLRADDERLAARLAAGAAPADVDRAASQAIARHPADYHLELLDAIAHVRAGDAAALHHLNRVLRLRPLDVEAHRLAGLTLARARRPHQAALEYRTALAAGLAPTPALFAELAALLGPVAVDAVPQEPPALVAFAESVARAHPALADLACARALDLAPGDERAPLAALRIAVAAGPAGRDRVVRAATTLARVAESADARLAAAAALHAVGLAADELRVLARAVESDPADGAVGLAWARLHLEGGDLAGARAALARLERATSDLDTRRRAEELRAVVEERAGDPVAALGARLRARTYGKALAASSTVGGDKIQ